MLSDVDRLLRHRAREAVEGLEVKLAPVHPRQLAESIVCAHFHLSVVRAQRAELIASIADYVRELRARTPHEREEA
jgi:hypothetical protein